jgi:hypothetical protein
MRALTRSTESQLKGLDRHRRLFQHLHDLATKHFAQRIQRCEQSVLDALFASHPDLEAVAFTVRLSRYNDEGPESGLDGILLAGEITTDHPACMAAQALFDKVEAAAYVCWPGDEDAPDEVTIARRSGPASCQLSVEDAWEQDGHEWLEELAATSAHSQHATA